MIRFRWDARKAEINLKKHETTFDEAASVFYDPGVVSWQDDLIDGELRWRTIGVSEQNRLLFVAHTTTIEEDEDEIVRIISARDATPRERRLYGNREL